MTLQDTFKRYLMLGATAGCSLMFVACATAPKELETARSTYKSVKEDSVTQQFAAAELREAELALKTAEREFEDEGDDESTRTYSYIAQRRAIEASVIAETRRDEQQRQAGRDELIDRSEKVKDQYKDAYQRERVAKIMTAQQLDQARNKYSSAEKELGSAREKLEEARNTGKMSEQEIARMEKELALKEQRLTETATKLQTAEAERKKLEAALTSARQDLVDIAKVKEEQSRMVITLNGEVLFKTGESELMPAAQRSLEQVAKVLKTHKEKYIMVEGHTDSRGDDNDNMNLSRARANSVMTFLVSRGVDQSHIKAVGVGESRPVASNDSPEGRANNRRVEIILSDEDEPANAQ